ncbi:MAG: DUF3105 domain-containing protein [SAR202 cluster bacterium]|nr:DUF3105 domain-containing protein [SAR202 cluster bacterium]
MPVSRRRRGRAATRSARAGTTINTTRRKGTNKFYLAASILIAVLVIASFAFASISGGGSGGASNTGSANGYVDGVGFQIEIEGDTHVNEGQDVTYNSAPPASGNHWPIPARCGFYEEELPDERVVHNMEHGNIIVSYNLTNEVEINSLKDALDDIGLNNIWGVTRAYSEIPEGQVALSAWGVIDFFPGVNADRIDKFFETYAGTLGPEGGIPC